MALWSALPVPIRRLAYRLAYQLLRVYWLVWHPTVTGAKCVLTHGDEVLLVRHTYGRPGWDLPGGGVRSGEAPEATARREIREELGLTIDDWRRLGVISGRSEHRVDALHCFAAELDADQVRHLVLDHGEIAGARWFPQTQPPAELGTYVRRVLALMRTG